jgi:hypothetical protein
LHFSNINHAVTLVTLVRTKTLMNFSRPCRQSGWAGRFRGPGTGYDAAAADNNVACELPRSVLMNFRAGVHRKMKSTMCHAQRERTTTHLFQLDRDVSLS